ncbi:MAG: class I SAM-dependent methyltransferase [Candidatus Kuenenia sp.]|nr:class I SAM-dependent methyltransferase [Candidatus Kuenenia hertensis]
MDRIFEPELMVGDGQAYAYAHADFSEPHNNFIKMFQKQHCNQEMDGYVLDIGCGPGDIMFRFARAHSNCIIHGIDGSDAMIRYGKKFLENASDIQHRIVFIQGILPEKILPRKKYDAVISNSFLHHLHNPHVLWNVIKKYAVPGAPIFIMDLRRPKSIDDAQRLMKTYVANEPEVLRKDFYHSLLAAFEVEEIIEQLKIAGLSHLSVNIASDRHVIVSGYMK